MILEDVVVDGEERHIEVVSVDFVIHADLLQDAVVVGEERHEERHIEVVAAIRAANCGPGFDFVIHANLLGDSVDVANQEIHPRQPIEVLYYKAMLTVHGQEQFVTPVLFVLHLQLDP